MHDFYFNHREELFMTRFEDSFKVQEIAEQFRNFEIDKDVAERELRLLGLNEDQVKFALGQVILEG